MTHRGKIILLPPNRVWRTYQGGRFLDELSGNASPRDSHYPEDWIASVTRAINPQNSNPSEGLSQVAIDGDIFDLKNLVGNDPEYFLGNAHIAKFGHDPKILVKFIDSAIRLHFQVHPTADFAQKFLNAPSGKTEAYYVLAARPEISDPYIYIGFCNIPTNHELKGMIEAQDIDAIKSCMNKISVKSGETYFVPGGTPHALGKGLFLIEIQEPSDLVVRFEFERGGYLLPEASRFMGRGLDFCLRTFNIAVEGEAHYRMRPRKTDFSATSWREELIGSNVTPSFCLSKLHIGSEIQEKTSGFTIAIVTSGSGTLSVNNSPIHVERYSKLLLPAHLGEITYTSSNGEPMEILECRPPLP